jgi:hypothetical protein
MENKQKHIIDYSWNKKNRPYYIWTYCINSTFLDVIDKLHDRSKDLKILSLPEIQPTYDIEKGYEYYLKSDWSHTNVDIIYSGDGEYDRNFYENLDNYRHLNPKKHFFTLYFLYTTFFLFQKRYIIPPEINYTLKYHFTSYNRTPRPHRLYVIQLLKELNLLKNNSYSLFDFKSFGYSDLSIFNHFTGEHFDFKNFNVPISHIDNEKQINLGEYFELVPSYLNSSFQQVTETLYEPIFLTEKTFFPILTKKPFIIYGAKNINNVLKKFGFKLYNEIFDYSFDLIDDPVIRAQEYSKEIKRVCDTYTPHEIFNKLKKTTEINYKIAIDIVKNKKFIPNKFIEWNNELIDDNIWKNNITDWFHKMDNIDNY